MLSFTIFRIPVRVEPMFFLTMGLFGLMFAQSVATDQKTMLVAVCLFILIAFVSLLLHELGHALVGRRFTAGPIEILFIAFGGRAFFSHANFTKWQDIAVTAAGPIMNFLLAGILYSISLFVVPSLDLPQNNLLVISIFYAAIINIFWGLFNLLPIYPLDGGLIMHRFIRDPYKAHRASLIAGITLIALALVLGYVLAAIFIAMYAFQNYQIMDSMRR